MEGHSRVRHDWLIDVSCLVKRKCLLSRSAVVRGPFVVVVVRRTRNRTARVRRRPTDRGPTFPARSLPARAARVLARLACLLAFRDAPTTTATTG